MTADLVAMINHWMATPVNFYFGSSYGADLASLLLRPLSEPIADEFLAKLKQDIPVLSGLGDSQLSLVSESVGFDQKNIFIQVGTILIPLPTQIKATPTGETYRVDAG
jgi:hypothetical protein